MTPLQRGCGCARTCHFPLSGSGFQEESWSMLQPRASMSLLMSEIMRSHSSPSEGADWSSELPVAPLPLVVELEAELTVRRYLPKLSVMMPRPSFTPRVSRKFSKYWLSFSGMKGLRPLGKRDVGEKEAAHLILHAGASHKHPDPKD